MANELTQELLQLSPAERIQLAEALLDSVAEEAAPRGGYGVLRVEHERHSEKFLAAQDFEESPPPILDFETELVVSLPPKSRRAIQLQVTGVRKAEPRIVFDSSDV